MPEMQYRIFSYATNDHQVIHAFLHIIPYKEYIFCRIDKRGKETYNNVVSIKCKRELTRLRFPKYFLY